MATITRIQHVQYDTVNLLAVQGKGTAKFQKSGAPSVKRNVLGAVFTGRIRVTKSDNARGYFFLAVDGKRGQDRRRVFFDADARVGIGGESMSVEQYYNLLVLAERILG